MTLESLKGYWWKSCRWWDIWIQNFNWTLYSSLFEGVRGECNIRIQGTYIWQKVINNKCERTWKWICIYKGYSVWWAIIIILITRSPHFQFWDLYVFNNWFFFSESTQHRYNIMRHLKTSHGRKLFHMIFTKLHKPLTTIKLVTHTHTLLTSPLQYLKFVQQTLNDYMSCVLEILIWLSTYF